MYIPLSVRLSAPGCIAPALRWSVSRGSRRWPRAARRSHSAHSVSSETLCRRYTWPCVWKQENKHYTNYYSKSAKLNMNELKCCITCHNSILKHVLILILFSGVLLGLIFLGEISIIRAKTLDGLILIISLNVMPNFIFTLIYISDIKLRHVFF